MGATQTKPTTQSLSNMDNELVINAIEKEITEFNNERKRLHHLMCSIAYAQSFSEPSETEYSKIEKLSEEFGMIILTINSLTDILKKYKC
jgi:hypothetical protein